MSTETHSDVPAIVRFLFGAVCGVAVAIVPISISTSALQTELTAVHFAVLAGFGILLGVLATIQKEKFQDTLSRILESITSG